MRKLLDKIDVRIRNRDTGRPQPPELSEIAAVPDTGYSVNLISTVRKTIMAIDLELAMATDSRCRELMVKTAYSLRSLEERLQRSKACQNYCVKLPG